MATKEPTTAAAPHLALVINASERFARSNGSSYVGDLHRGAADEILEDAIRVLSLLEAYAYLETETPLMIDAHAVSTMASMLVEKLRSAQRHIAEAQQ